MIGRHLALPLWFAILKCNLVLVLQLALLCNKKEERTLASAGRKESEPSHGGRPAILLLTIGTLEALAWVEDKLT